VRAFTEWVGNMGVYLGVSCALLAPRLLAVHVSCVWKRGGDVEELCAYYFTS